jgi:hypothetical protein
MTRNCCATHDVTPSVAVEANSAAHSFVVEACSAARSFAVEACSAVRCVAAACSAVRYGHPACVKAEAYCSAHCALQTAAASQLADAIPTEACFHWTHWDQYDHSGLPAHHSAWGHGHCCSAGSAASYDHPAFAAPALACCLCAARAQHRLIWMLALNSVPQLRHHCSNVMEARTCSSPRDHGCPADRYGNQHSFRLLTGSFRGRFRSFALRLGR